MGKYGLGLFLPVPGSYPGFQVSKNGYFMAKSRLNEKGWLHFDQELAQGGKKHQLEFKGQFWGVWGWGV